MLLQPSSTRGICWVSSRKQKEPGCNWLTNNRNRERNIMDTIPTHLHYPTWRNGVGSGEVSAALPVKLNKTLPDRSNRLFWLQIFFFSAGQIQLNWAGILLTSNSLLSGCKSFALTHFPITMLMWTLAFGEGRLRVCGVIRVVEVDRTVAEDQSWLSISNFPPLN